MGDLKSNKLSLRQFAERYALLIETMTESSHNNKCPKIQASYDDYGVKQTNPLNSTIFYYYFSGSVSAGWANFILSSCRYPNQKLRTAYTNFFSRNSN